MQEVQNYWPHPFLLGCDLFFLTVINVGSMQFYPQAYIIIITHLCFSSHKCPLKISRKNKTKQKNCNKKETDILHQQGKKTKNKKTQNTEKINRFIDIWQRGRKRAKITMQTRKDLMICFESSKPYTLHWREKKQHFFVALFLKSVLKFQSELHPYVEVNMCICCMSMCKKMCCWRNSICEKFRLFHFPSLKLIWWWQVSRLLGNISEL